MSHLARFSFLAVILAHSSLARAADFYVNPESGSDAGDGSASNPWRTLQSVNDAGLLGTIVGAGDTLWLSSGVHGPLVLDGLHGSGTEAVVTIAAAAEQTPVVSRVEVTNSSFISIRRLKVTTEHLDEPGRPTLVAINSGSSDVSIVDCTIQTVSDASGWSAQDWIDKASNGISVGGTRIAIRNNVVANVDFGITVSATDSIVYENIVDGFSGDGLRGLGDHTVFEYNTVMNCYDVDDNHDDGFQSWSVGPDGVGTGEVVGIVLRGNTFINTTDPSRPLNGALQGIGCFDGTFRDWVVENNVIATDHWHGITLLGAVNSRIVNNTVLDINDTSPGPPWISIDAHKNGTPPTGCIVANNLTTALANHEDVTEAGNILIKDVTDDLSALFVDAAGFDMRLIAGTAPVDAADTSQANFTALIDAAQVERPQGAGIDVGAFEWHSGSATHDDAGPEQAPDQQGLEEPVGDPSGPEQATDNQGLEDPLDGVSGPDSASETPSDAKDAPELVASSGAGDGGGCSGTPQSPAQAPWTILAALFVAAMLRRRQQLSKR